MNTDRELEQIVRDWLADRAAEPARAGLRDALARVATTPRQRRGWLGRWLHRGAGTTRQPGAHGDRSDTDDRRHRLVFSVTAIAASATALALAATFALPQGAPEPGLVPGAATGTTHVVAADGSGDFTTISEAVTAAAPGDAVLVQPGRYAEIVVIDKDITLRGDGPRDEIVLVFPEGAPPNEVDPDGASFHAVMKVDSSDAVISGLTISPPWQDTQADAVAVLVLGGQPLLRELSIVSDAPPADMPTSFAFAEQARPVVQESTWGGYLFTQSGSAPTLQGNTISHAVVSLNGPGEVLVRGNTFLDGAGISASEGLTGVIEGNHFTDGTIGVDTGSDMIIRDNVLEGLSPLFGSGKISVHDTDSKAHILGNRLSGGELGIQVAGGSEATVESNELVDSLMGIAWSTTRPGSIVGNSIRGGKAGIVISAGSPAVVGNTVEDATMRGIAIGRYATPTLGGNSVCGCGTNLWLAEGATPDLGDNEICVDESGEAAA